MSRVKPPVGIWLIAGTWLHAAYGCRCSASKRCRTSQTDPLGHPAYWCPDWGRTDTDHLPTACCAHRHPTNAKEAEPA